MFYVPKDIWKDEKLYLESSPISSKSFSTNDQLNNMKIVDSFLYLYFCTLGLVKLDF